MEHLKNKMNTTLGDKAFNTEKERKEPLCYFCSLVPTCWALKSFSNSFSSGRQKLQSNAFLVLAFTAVQCEISQLA